MTEPTISTIEREQRTDEAFDSAGGRRPRVVAPRVDQVETSRRRLSPG